MINENKKIDQTLRLIASEIYQTAIKQEKKIKDTLDEGIFFIPELAFVFECGMAIMDKKDKIFSVIGIIPNMKREENLGNGGPSDLIFDFGEEKIVIEFKIKDKVDNYRKDIQKLQDLNCSHIKLFCALTDVFPKDIDVCRRIRMEEEENNVRLILDPKENYFKTKDTQYKSSVVCTVGVWEVDYKEF